MFALYSRNLSRERVTTNSFGRRSYTSAQTAFSIIHIDFFKTLEGGTNTLEVPLHAQSNCATHQ